MHYRGDAYSGCTIAGSFTTVNTSGVPTQLQGSIGFLCVTAYKMLPGDATGFSCSSAGITLATSCGARTGWNAWSVNTNADPAFYSCGHDFELLLNHGLVGTSCVSGYLVAAFSLKNRSGLQPQTHARPLALTVGGAANINWAGVEGCTNATTLSCTTVYSAVKLVDRPFIDICNTIYSVQKLIDTSNIGTGAAPSANSIACTVWESLQTMHGSTCGTFGYLLNCTVSSALQPEIPGRRAAMTAGGEIGINWGRIANCTTVQGLSCTSMYQVVRVTDTSNIGTGAAPSANSIACTVWESLQATHGGTCGTFGYLLNCTTSSALQPQVPGRRLTVTSGGAANINWAGVESCTNATTLSCTSIYTADHLVQRPIVDSCSAIFSVSKIIDPPVVDSCSVIYSVQKVVDRPIVDASSVVASVSGAVGSVTGNVGGNVAGSVGSVTAAVSIDPCSTVYRVETVSQCVVRTTLQSRVITEPSAVFTYPASVADIEGWMGALASNCITVTASHQSLCNRAVSSTIASADLTCSSTIVHRGTFGTVIP